MERKNLKVIIFDIDGTLTEGVDSWYFLTEHLGGDVQEHQRVLQTQERGELSESQAKNLMLNRVWHIERGITKKEIEEIFNVVPIKKDAGGVIRYLKDKDYILCLITGSVEPFAKIIAEKLGIDYYYANTPFVYDDHGVLIDYHRDPEADKKKLEQLKVFLTERGLEPEECVAVGNSWNDIELFSYTGNGIAVKSPERNEELENIAWKTIAALSELKEIL